MVSIVYDGDKVLTTDENLPMIEIDENYCTREINSDFQFLVKLSFNWNEIDNYKHLIEQTINASGLRFRYLVISAIKQIQVNKSCLIRVVLEMRSKFYVCFY